MHNKTSYASSNGGELRSLFQEICNNATATSADRGVPHSEDCVLHKAALDTQENIIDCAPFEGGANNIFGLNGVLGFLTKMGFPKMFFNLLFQIWKRSP